jgi:hypothetical protein
MIAANFPGNRNHLLFGICYQFKDVATDVENLATLFFVVGACLADFAGEKSFPATQPIGT